MKGSNNRNNRVNRVNVVKNGTAKGRNERDKTITRPTCPSHLTIPFAHDRPCCRATVYRLLRAFWKGQCEKEQNEESGTLSRPAPEPHPMMAC